MNVATLLRAFVSRQPLAWVFHVLTLGLGVGIVLSLVLADRAIAARMERDLAGVDLVIGAKGSPAQLVLSALLQVDTPTGNIPLAEVERFRDHPLVRTVIPLSLGDSFRGMRIVGTIPEYAELYAAGLQEGRWWNTPMETVIGASVARQLGLKLGDSFAGEHGLSGGVAHADQPYTVVGILQATGSTVDRLVLTDLASVWQVHEVHEADEAMEHTEEEHVDEVAEPPRQVTALLVRYRSPMAAILLPRLVSATPDLQPAVPALEVARLVNLLGTGASLLRWIGLSLLGLAAGGFVVTLFSALSQRRRELALLRALGARPRLLLALIVGEGAALGLAGGIVGLLLARGLSTFVAMSSAGTPFAGMQAPPLGSLELVTVGVALLLAVLAAIPPAWIASRIDPAMELAKGAA